MRSFVDDLVVIPYQIVDTLLSVKINLSYRLLAYWFCLLSIACLLLPGAIFVKYCIKRGLTMLYLLLYLYNHERSFKAITFSRRQKYFSINNAEAHCSMNVFTCCMGQNYEKFLQQFLEKEGCEAEITTEPMFLDLE